MMLRKRQHKQLNDSSSDELDEAIEGRRTYCVKDKLDEVIHVAKHVQDKAGKDVNYEDFQLHGFEKPILVKHMDGLGARMPSSTFTVDSVMKHVGALRMVDVINTTTQHSEAWPMEDFVEYYNLPRKERKKIYNVISLEFTGTSLDPLVQSPIVVRECDWAQKVWPRKHILEYTEDLDSEELRFPKVFKYCLMSVAECFTDFHIDLGGTSVWYHVLRGKKTFWLIPPTQENLNAFEEWSKSGEQEKHFFADMCTDCQVITLEKGHTFLIPTGWIHAVYTHEDSLVFGGNFLHSFNIGLQLRIAGLEEKLRVPSKFRYPFFNKMQWYVYDHYNIALTGKSLMTIDDKPVAQFCELLTKEPVLCKYELQGLRHLREWLPNQPAESVPEELKKRSELLESMMVCLAVHAKDDAKIPNPFGRSMLQWKQTNTTVSQGKLRSPKQEVKSMATADVVISIQDTNKNKKLERRPRCGVCMGCRREDDCRKCVHCTDMKKYGGPGAMKQRCKLRKCSQQNSQELGNITAIKREPEKKSMISTAKSATPKTVKSTPKTSKATPMSSKSTPQSAKSTSVSKKSSRVERRSKCGICSGCKRIDDCKKCAFCLDMKKYGGSGRMKQCCQLRKCTMLKGRPESWTESKSDGSESEDYQDSEDGSDTSMSSQSEIFPEQTSPDVSSAPPRKKAKIMTSYKKRMKQETILSFDGNNSEESESMDDGISDPHKQLLSEFGEGEDMSAADFGYTQDHIENLLESGNTGKLELNGGNVVMYTVPGSETKEMRVFVKNSAMKKQPRTTTDDGVVPTQSMSDQHVFKQDTVINTSKDDLREISQTAESSDTSLVPGMTDVKIVNSLKDYMNFSAESNEKLAFLSLSCSNDAIDTFHNGYILAVGSNSYLYKMAASNAAGSVIVTCDEFEVTLPLVFGMEADVLCLQQLDRPQITGKQINKTVMSDDTNVYEPERLECGAADANPISHEDSSQNQANIISQSGSEAMDQTIAHLTFSTAHGDSENVVTLTADMLLGTYQQQIIQTNHLDTRGNFIASAQGDNSMQVYDSAKDDSFNAIVSEVLAVPMQVDEHIKVEIKAEAMEDNQHSAHLQFASPNVGQNENGSVKTAVLTLNDFFPTVPSVTPTKPTATPKPARKSFGRKKACGKCKNCLAEDCRTCTFCRDKPKYGGPGRQKQKCMYKTCLNPYGDTVVEERQKTLEDLIPALVNSTKRLEEAAIASNAVSENETKPIKSVPEAEVSSMAPPKAVDVTPKVVPVKTPQPVIEEEIKRIKKLPNCATCIMCLDRPEYGGKYKKRQMCLVKKSKINAYLESVEPIVGPTDSKSNTEDDSEDDQGRACRKRKLTSKMEESLVQEWNERVSNILPSERSEEIIGSVDAFLQVIRDNTDITDKDSKARQVDEAERKLNVAVLGDIMNQMTDALGERIDGENQPPLPNADSTLPVTVAQQSALSSEDILVHVLRFLPRSQVLRCGLVCKIWNQASKHKSLWYRIDLSKRAISMSVAESVVKLQPEVVSLNKAITNADTLETLLTQLSLCSILSMKGISVMPKLDLSNVSNSITELDLSYIDDLDDSVFGTLFSNSRFSMLMIYHLDVSYTKVGDASLRNIARYLPNLASLCMNGCNKITNNGFSSLGSSLVPSVQIIELMDCEGIDGQCLKVITTGKGLSQLRSLNLNGCPRITPKDMKAFVSSTKSQWRNTRKHLLKYA